MNGKEPTAPSWCCVDCLMWLANGDTSGMSDEDRETWQANFQRVTGNTEVTLGMLAEFHDCTDDDGNIADECDCETRTFSWSACGTCGSNLGGERHAVTFWV